jgi:hypothetical protein
MRGEDLPTKLLVLRHALREALALTAAPAPPPKRRKCPQNAAYRWQ